MSFFKKYKKLFAYGICGVLATLVDLGTYWLFYNIVLPSVLSGGFLTTVSNIIAWVFSVAFAFVTNKLFVFNSKSLRPMVLLSELFSFVLARLGTGALNTGLMFLFVDVFSLEEYNLLIKFIVTVAIVILNFILSEFLVFRKKRMHRFSKLLYALGVEYHACVPLSRCKVVKSYLLEKNGFDENANVVMMLIPYRPRKAPKNLTVYASVKDYHLYVDKLSQRLEAHIKKRYPNAKFKVFADHSPIDEVHASCISGLGFMGDNGLLINEKYSSFVFLAECITDLTPKELGLTYAKEEQLQECLHCGACKKACPTGCIVPRDSEGVDKKRVCLSAITQKKGELTSDEQELILKNGSIWGCDMCQNACPYTKEAKCSPIEFFNEDVIACLTSKKLDSMTDEEFKARPFAWRGKETIKRNVELWENDMVLRGQDIDEFSKTKY